MFPYLQEIHQFLVQLPGALLVATRKFSQGIRHHIIF